MLAGPIAGGAAYFANASLLPGGALAGAALAPSTGPTLQPDTPFNILDSAGAAVRVDNASSNAYVGAGEGGSAAEQFLAYDLLDPGRTSAFAPGSSVLLKSKVMLVQLGSAGC